METGCSSTIMHSSTASTPDQEGQQKIPRRTSPFMQYFQMGQCKLCGREFRGLKASNGKRHLEMKHPAEYEKVIEHKKRNGTLYKMRKSVSTVSSTDDEEFSQRFANNSTKIGENEEDIEGDELTTLDSNFMDIVANSNYQSSPAELDAQLKEYVVALEASARPLRRLALFAGTSGISSDFMENKHLREILKLIPNMPLPSAHELEQQINLEVSEVLLRIHRTLNSLPCGFCVSADVVPNQEKCQNSKPHFSMGIVAHFWNFEQSRAEMAALDIIQLNENPSLEFVAETLKHAFNKTDLNALKIYRTIVESSGCQMKKIQINSSNLMANELKLDQRNYNSSFYVGSCASYRLRVALDDVLSNDLEGIELQKRVLRLIENLFANPEILQCLQSKTGNLPFPDNLNWPSMRDLYEKVLEYSTIINQLCLENKWPIISRQDLQIIGGFLLLDKPIEQFAQKLEDDNIPTCSLLFPGLKQLLHELKVNSTNPRLSHLLRTTLSSRFVDVLTSVDENSDPFYLAASFLDPTIAHMLNSYEHLALGSIKTICSRILGKNANFTNPSTSTSQISTQTLSQKATPFGFKHTSSSFTPQQHSSLLPQSLDQEIKDYLAEVLKSPWTSNAYDFWRIRSKKYPILTIVAPPILVVPASSGSAKNLLEGLTNGAENSKELWKKALLTFNDSYISV